MTEEIVLKQDDFAELPIDKFILELTPEEKAFVNAWKGQASECDIATLLRMFGAKMDGGETE